MVDGSIRIMVPAGIIAMGGRAVPAWNGSLMAGMGVEQWTTCYGVALQKRHIVVMVPPMMQMRLMKRHDGSLIQHTDFGEPATGCRLPIR